jgi:hypothetical protein
MSAPFMIPEAPSPATARPAINMRDEVDTPQSSDPSSKTARRVMKVLL